MLEYDPETGIFTRNGVRAGTVNAGGYRQVRIEGRLYYEHRVAWLLMTGEWPPDQIDHIDGNRANNVFSNLRLASQVQNNWNSNSRNALRGTHLEKSRNRWRADIVINGQTHFLGRYDTPEEAHNAYVEVAKELQGEFYSNR